MQEIQKELLKTILKIEEKDDKLLVTVGAPRYEKGGKRVKVNADELGYILQLEGKYKNIVSVTGGTYVNFWDDYQEEVIWEYTYEVEKKPKLVKEKIVKSKPVVEKKIVKKNFVPRKEVSRRLE